ncbi:MFS transporter [Lacisediminimonas profundi]|uniref:MFS transporter n=1 Tax=Lacisediminimonas profundi TaxID=2603856 RepID=UPI001F4F2BAA|nr:MFS transporter [Lacisediminimonas profundi]
MPARLSPFWRVCFAMCVGVMGTALASPLYPFYQELWHLKSSDITGIFSAYMFGVMGSLLFLGRLTNRFGFLPILGAGSTLMTLGVLLSMLAWNPAAFVASRLVIGLASGMITTSASIGLNYLNDSGDAKRTAVVTTFGMTLGFGLGPLIGGLVAQWAPAPLVSAYVPSLLLGLLATWGLFRIPVQHQPPRPPSAPAKGSSLAQWLPSITLPPSALRRHFWIACMGTFSAFGMFSLYASLAPSFMQDMLPWHGPAVSGISIAMILFLSSAFQLLARRTSTRTTAIAGLGALALCNLLLLLTTYSGSTFLFMLSVLVTAFGHGLANLTGMSLVGKVATPGTRAGLLSSYLIVAYVGAIAPILGVGWLSDHLGLTTAVVIFCTVMALLTATLALIANSLPPIRTPAG